MIAVLSFDIGGTLIKGGEGGFCSFVCKSLGCSFESVRSLLEKHFLTTTKSMVQSLNEFYDALGIVAGDRRYPERCGQSSEVFEDVIVTLRHVKEKGLRLITLSNCTQWEAAESLPIELESLLEASFRSCELGRAKPNVEIFGAVEVALDVESKKFVHIGDSWEADIMGAIASGWKAIYIDRLSNRSSFFYRESIPVISSLHQLIPVLEHNEWI